MPALTLLVVKTHSRYPVVLLIHHLVERWMREVRELTSSYVQVNHDEVYLIADHRAVGVVRAELERLAEMLANARRTVEAGQQVETPVQWPIGEVPSWFSVER